MRCAYRRQNLNREATNTRLWRIILSSFDNLKLKVSQNPQGPKFFDKPL
jgi:hypothetical protein